MQQIIIINKMTKSKSASSTSKATKRTGKYLATTRNPRIQQLILRSTPPTVIKSICNAALNAQRGEIKLSSSQKRILAKHRSLIDALVDEEIPIESKRANLVRSSTAGNKQEGKGIGALIPILLSTVLSTIGSSFISGNK